MPEDELEAAAERLVEEMEIEWRHRPGTVAIEFVLPWQLFNAEVDWWRGDRGLSETSVLALRYPVVIRSLARLRNPRWHRDWRQRWQQLQSAPASSSVYWSRPAGEDYFTRLEAELMSDGRFVALVLSEPPSAGNQTGRREVEAALRTGLPVIIWHRTDCGSAPFKEAVMNLISDSGVAQLPMRARQLRLAALREEPAQRNDHVGRHLTVLWDDPDRIPDPPGAGSGRFAQETQ